MIRTMAAPLGALLLLGTACATRVDVASEAGALLQTDKAWEHAASAGQNVDSVLAYWTDDAMVVSPGEAPLKGKAAIRQMVESSFKMPGFHVTWTPDSAVVSRSGDLGYTYGTNAFTIPDSTGKTTTMNGRYITVWQKQADGKWHCVMDFSSPAQ